MFMDSSGIDLFDQNTGKTCGYIRFRHSWIITGIDLFDQNANMTCG